MRYPFTLKRCFLITAPILIILSSLLITEHIAVARRGGGNFSGFGGMRQGGHFGGFRQGGGMSNIRPSSFSRPTSVNPTSGIGSGNTNRGNTNPGIAPLRQNSNLPAQLPRETIPNLNQPGNSSSKPNLSQLNQLGNLNPGQQNVKPGGNPPLSRQNGQPNGYQQGLGSAQHNAKPKPNSSGNLQPVPQNLRQLGNPQPVGQNQNSVGNFKPVRQHANPPGKPKPMQQNGVQLGNPKSIRQNSPLNLTQFAHQNSLRQNTLLYAYPMRQNATYNGRPIRQGQALPRRYYYGRPCVNNYWWPSWYGGLGWGNPFWWNLGWWGPSWWWSPGWWNPGWSWYSYSPGSASTYAFSTDQTGLDFTATSASDIASPGTNSSVTFNRPYNRVIDGSLNPNSETTTPENIHTKNIVTVDQPMTSNSSPWKPRPGDIIILPSGSKGSSQTP